MKINGKNLLVTHTTQIQLSETYAIPRGMRCEMHGWMGTEARKRVSSGQVSSFKLGGKPRASDCGTMSVRLYQALSDQKGACRIRLRQGYDATGWQALRRLPSGGFRRFGKKL